MTRALRGRAVALGAVAVSAVLVAALGAGPDEPVAAAENPNRSLVATRGQFAVECGLSHSAPDDPIVHPGRPGWSHRHDFFGATGTDAWSTPASLFAGASSCEQQLDRAAYWAPGLLRDGEYVTPVRGDAYYRAAEGTDPTDVEPYPFGLVMIAGDAHAAEPQDLDVVAWACGRSPRIEAVPRSCPGGAPLALRITFPDCWNGRDLDSADHVSHVARSRGGRCPATHPVLLPLLTFVIHYPVTGDPAGLELASGAIRTGHADFVNAWDPAELERQVRLCIHADAVCGVPGDGDRGATPSA